MRALSGRELDAVAGGQYYATNDPVIVKGMAYKNGPYYGNFPAFVEVNWSYFQDPYLAAEFHAWLQAAEWADDHVGLGNEMTYTGSMGNYKLDSSILNDGTNDAQQVKTILQLMAYKAYDYDYFQAGELGMIRLATEVAELKQAYEYSPLTFTKFQAGSEHNEYGYFDDYSGATDRINLTALTDATARTIMHELLHAMGHTHEAVRAAHPDWNEQQVVNAINSGADAVLARIGYNYAYYGW